jgi:RNA polymerase sigma-70 factor (ECF subfamily)
MRTAMSAQPSVESQTHEALIKTLGDLLYADPGKSRVPETAWFAVIQAIAGQDAHALRILYERMHRLVFTVALRITESRETAEEVTLDVFHDIWRHANRYDPLAGTVVGWVMNQARSRALDRLRYEKRQKRVNPFPVDSVAATSETSADNSVEQRDVARSLRDAIRVLTADERSAIEIAYFSGMSHVDIAARLNQPLGTIKTRIRSGLQKLRRAMRGPQEEK